MKRIVLLAMVGLYALGWCVTGKALVEKPAEYYRLLEEAKAYEENKIYVRAIDSYKQALSYNPNSANIQLCIAADYLALGDETSFINRCNAVNSSHGYPLETVNLLLDFYTENKRDEKAIDLLTSALKKHKKNEQLQERYEELRYAYKDLYVRYDEILNFRNDSAVYQDEEAYGLLSTSGKNLIRNHNEYIGVLSGERDAVPIKKDGEFYYADKNGYRYEVPKEGQQVEELGVLCNGVAPAKINGKYGYVNMKFEEQSAFDWDGATVIQNGFGAVKQGEKWALINSSYALITDYLYDDVKVDDYQYCSISGRAFVKNEAGYQMVDEKGAALGTGGYEDAVPFLAEEPAAVKVNGKWGFVGMDGQLVIEPQYEAAGSFSGGLAPVQTMNGWGYIDLNNQLVIPDNYTGAKSFYKGVAPVCKGNSWTLIQLYVR